MTSEGKGLDAVEHAARVIRAFRQAATKSTLLEGRPRHERLPDPVPRRRGLRHGAARRRHPRGHDHACQLRAPAGNPGPAGQSARRSSSRPPVCRWGLGAPPRSVTRGRAGDRILLYTDGLSEARNEHGDFLPLLDVASMLAMGGLDEALDALLDLARAHVPHRALADDLAVLLLENTAVPAAAAGSADMIAPGSETGQYLGPTFNVGHRSATHRRRAL